MSKRFVSIITLIVMVLSCTVFCLPVMAVAEKTVWDGTEVQPTADGDENTPVTYDIIYIIENK